MEKLKIVIKDGNVATATLTVGGKQLLCHGVDIKITPYEIKAVVTIYDIDLDFEGTTDVLKTPFP